VVAPFAKLSTSAVDPAVRRAGVARGQRVARPPAGLRLYQNPAAGCKAAAAIDQSMDLSVSQSYDSCMKDEESARRQLFQTWSKYTPQEKSRCVGQTEVGGTPSYVEVLECLLVTVGVDKPIGE
jgi:hypothetical protein